MWRFQVAGFHVMWVLGVVDSTIVVLDIVSKTVNRARRFENLRCCQCDGSLISQYMLAVDLPGGYVLPEAGMVGKSG